MRENISCVLRHAVENSRMIRRDKTQLNISEGEKQHCFQGLTFITYKYTNFTSSCMHQLLRDFNKPVKCRHYISVFGIKVLKKWNGRTFGTRALGQPTTVLIVSQWWCLFQIWHYTILSSFLHSPGKYIFSGVWKIILIRRPPTNKRYKGCLFTLVARTVEHDYYESLRQLYFPLASVRGHVDHLVARLHPPWYQTLW